MQDEQNQHGQGQGDGVDGSQDQGQQGEGTQVSQETPTEDSGLQTPQADQPVPREGDRDGQGQETQPDAVGGSQASPGPSGQEAEGAVKPRFEQPEPSGPVTSGGEQDPVQREQELQDERQEHNARTGGGEVNDGEVQQARQEHNDRTGGGQVPGAESSNNESQDQGESQRDSGDSSGE